MASATQSWATFQVARSAGKPCPERSSCLAFPETSGEAKERK